MPPPALPAFASLAALAATGCVLAKEHERTDLLAVCTEGAPLLFMGDGATGATAILPIVGLGARVEAEGARASMQTLTIDDPGLVDDFAFAERLTATFVAPTSGLPDVVVATRAPVPPELPLPTDVDATIDLVPYLLATELHLAVALVGPPPAPEFSATLAACLDVDGVVIE